MESNIRARYLAAKRRLFDIYYEALNERQREAVYTTEGNLLVLAGAGSGKTTVLVHRIAFIIKYGNAYYSDYVPYDIGEERVKELEAAAQLPHNEIEQVLNEFISSPCPPWNILAITFTNKAAGEIKNRLRATVPEGADDIWAGTFHSVCARILRVYGDRLGYAKDFTIYDATDTKNALKEVIRSLNIDEKTLNEKTAASMISHAKNELMDADDFEKEFGQKDFRYRMISKTYKKYAERLRSSNAMDFDDLIMNTVLLLENDAEVREYFQKKFRYISVDEFQDTNVAQLRLTALFAGGRGNLMVVGDDDQSIYRFRGAVVQNILTFDKKFKNTKTIRLEQNYRSTNTILKAANAVIDNNEGRLGKNLWSDKGDGEKIVLRVTNDQNEEARYIVDAIQKAVSSGERKYRDFAVLYRTNAQSQIIERVFAKSALPYRMFGGLRFNDRKEIRDIVAYLQFIVNPTDRERMRRIINEPKRKIGAKTVDGVEIIAEEQGVSVFQVMLNADKYPALSRSAKTLRGFAEIIEALRLMLNTDMSLEDFVNQVLDLTGYRQMLIDGGEEEKDRLENIEEFISGVIEYERNNDEPTLLGFLEENALVSEVDKYDEDADASVLMTMHSAKGLEFPVVFLPGMEEGLFPGNQTIMGGQDEMEEERRLAYVAITRAKDKLYILRTRSRMLYGRTSVNPPSRFIDEIPSSLVNEDTPFVAAYSSYGSYSAERPKVYFHADDGYAVAKKPTPAVPAAVLKEGDRVKHFTFGEGEVLSVKPMGSDVLYEVAFDRVGTKKLMGNYAKLKKLN